MRAPRGVRPGGGAQRFAESPSFSAESSQLSANGGLKKSGTKGARPKCVRNASLGGDLTTSRAPIGTFSRLSAAASVAVGGGTRGGAWRIVVKEQAKRGPIRSERRSHSGVAGPARSRRTGYR